VPPAAASETGHKTISRAGCALPRLEPFPPAKDKGRSRLRVNRQAGVKPILADSVKLELAGLFKLPPCPIVWLAHTSPTPVEMNRQSDESVYNILAKFLAPARVLHGIGLAHRVFLKRGEIFLARFDGRANAAVPDLEPLLEREVGREGSAFFAKKGLAPRLKRESV